MLSPEYIEPPDPSAKLRTGNQSTYSTRVYKDFAEAAAVDLRTLDNPRGLDVGENAVVCTMTRCVL